jgi:tetrahydromethanopterin S-methyltransferase subunit F
MTSIINTVNASVNVETGGICVPSAYRLLSTQQLESGKQIIDYFNSHDTDNRWAVLLAQMQSGKTETYLFIVAEMIRLKRVKHVVIFSGNSETQLKAQIVRILKNDVDDVEDSFYRKYRSYLATIGVADNIIESIEYDIRRNTSVVWGSELTKFAGSSRNTLFIWEESHYAQNKTQMPAKMMRNVGISANGDAERLATKGNYVISVSATGFSELSCNVHQKQGKWVQLLQPGEGYNGLETMMQTGRIVPYDNVLDGLTDAMATEHCTPKYAVIRATQKTEAAIRRRLEANGWKVVNHDSVDDEDNIAASRLRQAEGKSIWDNMKVAPLQDTAIILKGLCRMGQNVKKEHVLFFFETAVNANTDTALQSFIGRACGYSTGSNQVKVYIPSKIYNSGNLEKYILLAKGNDILPSKARNIVSDKNITQKHTTTMEIIPIRIPREFVPSVDDSEHRGSARRALQADVVCAFENRNFENFNSPTILAKIIAKVMATEKFDRRVVSRHATYVNVAENIKISVDSRMPVVIGSSCGVKEDNNIDMWVMSNKDVYINCVVLRDVDDIPPPVHSEQDYIPKTTGKEVFSHQLEDGTTETSNGGFSLHLTPETAFSTDQMMAELSELIELSLKPMIVSVSRCINSVKDSEYKGINLNAEVLAGLQPNGCLSRAILQRFNVQLKITKMSGRQSNAHKAMGLTRIAKISW